jgi:hypothetical protein
LTGCNALLGIEELTDPEVCLGQLSICAEPIATDLTISAGISTDREKRCENRGQSGGPDFCLISARSITITGNVPVTGERPLVLFANEIVVTANSTLDASSRRGATTGANANADCEMPQAPAAGGGAAGGSFGRRGGDGGNGDGGTRGVAAAAVTPTILRGGCPGGAGGVADGSTPAAIAGDGGGAIYLLAGQSITIDATASVRASGAGGSPSASRGGGAGGGSGGMIILDAPMVSIAGQVVAHGGGGSEGATAANQGLGGLDGPTEFNMSGRGGAGGSPGGGDGGNGSSMAIGAAPGMDGGIGAGGGGGGGGDGIVRIVGSLTGGAMVSPSPM